MHLTQHPREAGDLRLWLVNERLVEARGRLTVSRPFGRPAGLD